MAVTRQKIAIKKSSPNGSVPRNMANAFQNPTPQGKIGMVADELNIPGIKGQQGTLRTIFHALPLTEGANAETTYPFFKNVKSVSAPFTNINENKLQSGEAIAVQRIYFGVMTITTATGAVLDYETFDQFSLPAMYGSTWNLKLAQQEYTKDNWNIASKPEFNRNAMHAAYNVYHTSVNTVIPPDIQFTVPFDAPAMLIPSSETLEFYIFCAIEGVGSVLNMRKTL